MTHDCIPAECPECSADLATLSPTTDRRGQGMKIIKLSASNVKRLRAVEINPDGTLQIVTGRNAQGKSSVLDAIWLALGGGAASRETPRPVRDGEERAEVSLDLGDLLVTRTWDAEKGKTELVVRAPDGAKYSQPQTLLDQLVGKLSFDPLAFTRLSARDQRKALLDLLGLNFEAEDRERQRLYDERLETGRQAHAYGEMPKLDKGAPLTEKSAAEILDGIGVAQGYHHRINQHRTNIEYGERRIADLERQLDEVQAKIASAQATIRDERTALDACPAPADMEALRAELAEVENFNKIARENRRIADNREAQKALEEQYATLGRSIAAIDDAKAATLAATAMPVAGLGFDDSGVTYNGVPFQQASSAEQIKVSLAMAMALNPSLRVIRIMDGSLLDAESMAAITTMADDADYQIWLERVEDDSPAAVLIEDGSVVQR